MTRIRVGETARDYKALAAVTVTMVLWSSAFVAIRYAGAYFHPGALALGRLLVGACALALLLRSRGQMATPRAAWPGIVGVGVFWFGLYTVALNWGEKYTDAGTAAMVAGLGPILAALLGAWWLKEGFSLRLVAALGIAFAGSALVGIASSGGGGRSAIGVALCVLAAAGYAIGVVGQKRALSAASALQITCFGCAVGAAVCLPFAGQLVGDLAHAPAGAILAMIYLALLPTTVGFWTWAYALSHSTVGVLSATTYLVPVLAVFFSWALLGQVPAPLAYLGGALCLAGIVVSRRRPRPADPAHVHDEPEPTTR
ncbi:DMT family transporter [Amycolatopsis sp. NPDC059090]|uniref:DMT family transporter n=1 Tax=Amycolatopsis sp. NPDC059090 TaxID=3346723 RepID=UPI0036724B4B